MNIRDSSAPIIAIVGPTASGKSALAQEIAQAMDGEVLSADSMQIYRGMDIGTGKVLPADRKVPHHGLDIVDPGEPYSAALFQAYGRDVIAKLDAASKRTVLCGGTGFYVRAVIDDYDFPDGEQVHNPVRDKYNLIAEQLGAHELWSMLDARDPKSAAIIPENDVKRVVRAFELLEDGTSYATQKERLSSIEQAIPAIFIGIEVDPGILRERIDERVDTMIQDGLVDEVKRLSAEGFDDALCANQAIGYKEMMAHLRGQCTLEEAASSIKIATHRYAKRQRTWFRKDPRITWLNGDDADISRLAQESLDIIDTIESEERDRP